MPVHGLVLATQSEFFKTGLSSQFTEARTKEFHFTEGSLQAYWRVFEYMYTGKYSEEPSDVVNAQGKKPIQLVLCQKLIG